MRRLGSQVVAYGAQRTEAGGSQPAAQDAYLPTARQSFKFGQVNRRKFVNFGF
jgi:hypothetical protein